MWKPASLAALLLLSAAPNLQAAEDTPGDEAAEAAAPGKPAPAGPAAEEERRKLIAWLRAEYTKPPDQWPKPELDEGVPLHELGTPGRAPAPETNPTTPAKSTLGIALFFDPRLSGSMQTSCSRCHDPELGWADGRSVASGTFMKPLKRNTPAILGAGHATSLFEDGRAPDLESQAVIVITNPDEMAGNPDEIVKRLQAEESYPPKFKAAFGDEEITFARITQALASFERSMILGRTAFDKFLTGKNPDAYPDDALAGLHLFRTTARCLNCHNGPMLTDNEFYNVGLTYYGRRFYDPGRQAVTGRPEDMGKFRTPGLRNVSRTGPWMHNGLFPRLDGVLRLYNAGMPHPKPKPDQESDPLFPVTSPHLKPLGLDATQLKDLEAFLRSLDEPPARLLQSPAPPVKQK